MSCKQQLFPRDAGKFGQDNSNCPVDDRQDNLRSCGCHIISEILLGCVTGGSRVSYTCHGRSNDNSVWWPVCDLCLHGQSMNRCDVLGFGSGSTYYCDYSSTHLRWNSVVIMAPVFGVGLGQWWISIRTTPFSSRDTTGTFVQSPHPFPFVGPPSLEQVAQWAHSGTLSHSWAHPYYVCFQKAKRNERVVRLVDVCQNAKSEVVPRTKLKYLLSLFFNVEISREKSDTLTSISFLNRLFAKYSHSYCNSLKMLRWFIDSMSVDVGVSLVESLNVFSFFTVASGCWDDLIVNRLATLFTKFVMSSNWFCTLSNNPIASKKPG